MKRLGDSISTRPSNPPVCGRGQSVVLLFVATLLFVAPTVQADQTTDISSGFLVTAPGISTSPAIAQNESSLAIDLNRNTVGIQSTLPVSLGDTIEGEVVIDDFEAYRGYALRVLIDPVEAVSKPLTDITFGPGLLPGSGVSAESENFEGLYLVMQDSVVPLPGSIVDVTAFPSSVFQFNITFSDTLPGDVTLSLIENDQPGIPSPLKANLGIFIPDPADPDTTLKVEIEGNKINLGNGTLSLLATATPTQTPTATPTPIFPAPVLLAPANGEFFTLSAYNSLSALHQWSTLTGVDRYRITRTDPNSNEVTFEVAGVQTTLGAEDGIPGYPLSTAGRYTWSVAGVDTLDREGAQSEVRYYDIGRFTPTHTPLATETPTETPTPTPAETRISGLWVMDRDLLVGKNDILVLESGSELVFQAFTDRENKGRDAGLSELIVEGVLRVEGFEGGSVPVSIRSDVIPTPTPMPTGVPTPVPPIEPYYQHYASVTQFGGNFDLLAPSLADLNGDGVADWLYFGEAEGKVYGCEYLGDGQFADPQVASATRVTGGIFTSTAGGQGVIQTDLSNPAREALAFLAQMTPISTSTETPTPTETSLETPTETPLETPLETPTETPTETPLETPLETPTETPLGTPLETPTEIPTETPTPTPTPTLPAGFEQIDAGEESIPYLVDANGDGSRDLFVGGQDGKIRAYENIAAPTDVPVFRQIADEVLRFADFDNKDNNNAEIEISGGVAPALGDINGDGILDLVIGNRQNQVVYYEGVADKDPLDFFNESRYYNRMFKPILNETSLVFEVDSATAGLAIPTLADFDTDGDLDLLVGAADGRLQQWENRLAQSEYVWPIEEFPDPELAFPRFPRLVFHDRASGFLQEIFYDGSSALISVGSRAAPSHGGLAGDERLDLLVGSEDGTIEIYERVSGPSNPKIASIQKGDSAASPAGPITSSIDHSARWGGIWFKDTSRDDGSKIENAIIEDAQVGIRITKSSPVVRDTSILDSRQFGIIVEEMAFPEIQNSAVASNSEISVAGILADRYSAPTLEDLRIVRNGRSGLLTRRYSFPVLRGSNLFTKHSIVTGNQVGVRIESNSAPRLGNVENRTTNDDGLIEFYENEFYDIYNDTPAEIKAHNNLWKTADPGAIDERIYDDNENPLKGRVDFLPLVKVSQDPTPTPTPTPPQGYIDLPTPTPTPTAVVIVEVGGVIETNTVWEGQILVVDDVLVDNGAVLELRPGTLVKFRETDPTSGETLRLEIRARNSTIYARGTRNVPIVFMPEFLTEEFTPGQYDPPYSGIVLEGPSLQQSEFTYCEFRSAAIGLNAIDNAPQVEDCEFWFNRRGFRVEATGGEEFPADLVSPTLRHNIFTFNEVALQVIGDATPDLGTLAEPGLNSFIFPDAEAFRFDIELISYDRSEAINAAGNYFLLRKEVPQGVIPVHLQTYGELVPRFTPGELYDPLLNPFGEINVWPLGTVLNGEDLTSGQILITKPEVWVGRLEFSGDVIILSEVRVLPGTEIVARPDGTLPSIIVAAGTGFYPNNKAEVLDGALIAKGREALPIVFRSATRTPGSWAGVRFSGQSTRVRSVLEQCELAHGTDQIIAVNSSPRLVNCFIKDYLDSGVKVMDDIAPESSEWFLMSSAMELTEVLPDHELERFVPINPFGVPAPEITQCEIRSERINAARSSDFCVVSQNSKPILRDNWLTLARIAGVFAVGANVPDMGTELDPGWNKFANNLNYNVVNLSITEIPACTNAWFATGGDFYLIDTEHEIDQTILDDDENPVSGRVPFDGFVDNISKLEKANAPSEYQVGQEDLQKLLRSWHQVEGQAGFKPGFDFNGSRQVNYRDLLHFAIQWKKSAGTP